MLFALSGTACSSTRIPFPMGGSVIAAERVRYEVRLPRVNQSLKRICRENNHWQSHKNVKMQEAISFGEM